jgi:hypothetical protein
LLSLSGRQTIDNVEKWLSEIARGESEQIALNTNLKFAELGGVGALIQLLITWSKRYPAGQLVLHTNDAQKADKHLENLSLYHHGLLALLLAADVITSDRAQSVRDKARAWAKQRVEQMIAEQLPGPDLLLFSADQTTKRFIPQFYYLPSDPYGRVRSENEFTELSQSLIQKVAKRYKNVPPPAPVVLNLSLLLYELFKNTHQWARTTVAGAPIKRSVRGIRLSLIPLNNLDVGSYSHEMKTYLESAATEISAFDLLEITIFDSGPGLAARGLKADIDSATSLESEYGAVLSCLKWHSTESTRSHRGLGLIEVLRTLTRGRCLLRMRTGRLALYRDFINHPVASDSDIWLLDWTSKTKTLFQQAWADGLLLAIYLPVEKRSISR